MLTLVRAAFFEVLGLWALWSITNDLRTGSTTTRGTTFIASENPGGFYLTVACKAACVCFAAAVVLNTLGLVGDPFAWFAETFPSMARR
jgi:hypothetical protein